MTNGPKKLTHRAQREALGFAFGFRCLGRGLRLAYVEHRELARLYLPPMLLAAVLLVTGLVLTGLYADDLVAWIWPEPTPAADAGTWRLLLFRALHALWTIASYVVIVVAGLLSALAMSLVFMLCAAPFSDFLSETVEGILGTWEPRPFSLRFLVEDLGRTVRFEALRIGLKLAWLVPLFIASLLIPVIGNILYTAVGGYILAKYTGMDFIDWCAARRGWGHRERLDFVKSHRGPILGLGTAVALTLMVPMGFAVAWPGAVAGGAILFTRLHTDDDAGNLLSDRVSATNEEDAR